MNANEPAFPEPYINDPHLALSLKPGLTKREYFAAMALMGMDQGYSDPKQAAEMSIRFADEFLKQLEL
jgi:hypothetical protein